MFYSFLADLIVAIHIAYVAYVVGGLAAILIGTWRGRTWIRNPWFRVTHLLAILIVAMECILKLNCPLTTWENSARAAAQQPADGSAFMDRLLTFILMGAAPGWVINGLYFVFAIAIAAAFFCAPPRWQWGAGRQRRVRAKGEGEGEAFNAHASNVSSQSPLPVVSCAYDRTHLNDNF